MEKNFFMVVAICLAFFSCPNQIADKLKEGEPVAVQGEVKLSKQEQGLLSDIKKVIQDSEIVKEKYLVELANLSDRFVKEEKISFFAGDEKIVGDLDWSRLQDIANSECDGFVEKIKFVPIDEQAEKEFIQAVEKLKESYSKNLPPVITGKICEEFKDIVREEADCFIFGQWKIDKRDENNLEYLKLVYGIPSDFALNKGVVFTNGVAKRTWPNGIIPYYFEKIEKKTIEDKDFLKNTRVAIKNWENETQNSIKFLDLNPEDNVKQITWLDSIWFFKTKDHILRICKSDNYNFVLFPGYGSLRTMYITNTNSVSTIMHELGHVLGLWHEQQKGYRDNYISVSKMKVDDSPTNLFNIWANDFYLFGGNKNIKGEYRQKQSEFFDFNSIMLYSRIYYLFENIGSKNLNEASLIKLNTAGLDSGLLSAEDKKFVADLYGNKFYVVKETTPRYFRTIKTSKPEELGKSFYRDPKSSIIDAPDFWDVNLGKGVYNFIVTDNSESTVKEEILLNSENSRYSENVDELYLEVALYRGQRIFVGTSINDIKEESVSNNRIFVKLSKNLYKNITFLRVVSQNGNYRDYEIIFYNTFLIPENVKFYWTDADGNDVLIRNFSKADIKNKNINVFDKIFTGTKLKISVTLSQDEFNGAEISIDDQGEYIASETLKSGTTITFVYDSFTAGLVGILKNIVIKKDNYQKSYQVVISTPSENVIPEDIMLDGNSAYTKGDLQIKNGNFFNSKEISVKVKFKKLAGGLQHHLSVTSDSSFTYEALGDLDLGDGFIFKNFKLKELNLPYKEYQEFILKISDGINTFNVNLLLKLKSRTVTIVARNVIFSEYQSPYYDNVWIKKLRDFGFNSIEVPLSGDKLLFKINYLKGFRLSGNTNALIDTSLGAGIKEFNRSISNYTNKFIFELAGGSTTTDNRFQFIDDANGSNSMQVSISMKGNEPYTLMKIDETNYKVNTQNRSNIEYTINKTEKDKGRKFSIHIPSKGRIGDSHGKISYSYSFYSGGVSESFFLRDYKNLAATTVGLEQLFFVIVKSSEYVF